jgi:hypothetical protein
MAYYDTNTVAPQDGQIRMNEALRDWLRTHTPVQTKPNPNKKPNPITPVGLFAAGQAGLAFIPISIHGLNPNR